MAFYLKIRVKSRSDYHLGKEGVFVAINDSVNPNMKSEKFSYNISLQMRRQYDSLGLGILPNSTPSVPLKQACLTFVGQIDQFFNLYYAYYMLNIIHKKQLQENIGKLLLHTDL